MTASEMTPIAKEGGLGDVVGSLPQALKKLGCDIRVIIPKYGTINEKKYKLTLLKSDVNIKGTKINIWQTIISGITVYLIDAPKYFGKKEIYWKQNNEPRYIFFSLACAEILPIDGFMPDIIHCHDNHTAILPMILKFKGSKIKTLYTIHNLAYQGKIKKGAIVSIGLADLAKKIDGNELNLMKQGILYSDYFNTVSQNYAKEILSHEYGSGLENIIKKRKKYLSGILNGINTDFFDPAKDEFINFKFNKSSLQNKTKNKLALQKEIGLLQNKNIPLAGIVTRFVVQKGINLINEYLIKNISQPCQYIFLGTGEKKIEAQLKNLVKKFPGQVAGKIMFNEKLAHQIYAGSDIFLIPSRYEPCGLTQMIAMRYGTIPVVRATGGLADTVNNNVGFTFKDFSSAGLRQSLSRAVETYFKPDQWKRMQLNSMKKDFSWNRSAKKYLILYKKLTK